MIPEKLTRLPCVRCDAERQLALVSVDHPDVVERYRRPIHGGWRGAERTDDLRPVRAVEAATLLPDLQKPAVRSVLLTTLGSK